MAFYTLIMYWLERQVVSNSHYTCSRPRKTSLIRGLKFSIMLLKKAAGRGGKIQHCFETKDLRPQETEIEGEQPVARHPFLIMLRSHRVISPWP